MSMISNVIGLFDKIEVKHIEKTYLVIKHTYDYFKVSNPITGKSTETESTSWSATDEGKGIANVVFKLGMAHGPKVISQGIKLLKK